MALPSRLQSFCFRRRLCMRVTCPILKFSSNLKPQARSIFSSFQFSEFLNCTSTSYFCRPNMWSKSLFSFNHVKSNSQSYSKRFLFCSSSSNFNKLFTNYSNVNSEIPQCNINSDCTYIAHCMKNGLNCRSSRNYSNKKSIINNKHLTLKRHELFKGVLREKQRKIRQTQLKLKRSGKLLLDDIKETKSKMKVKMEEIIERENIWTVPNMLCVARILISPYLGYVILNSNYDLALGLVIFAGVTDLLDGVIARTFKSQSSKLGSFLDPMADKVLIATLFLSLTISGNIPVPLTVLIVTRDIMLASAGFYIRYQSLPPPRTLSRYFDMSHATAQLTPTMLSKINTMVQLVTVFSTLTAVVFEYTDHPALYSLWYLTAGTTIGSAISYITAKDTYRILKKKTR